MVWADSLKKKNTRAVTGRGWVWQVCFASGRCGAGGSGFVLAASSRFVGLSCLLRELLWETCKVKGLLVKRAGKWIQTESLTPVLVAAGSSPQLWVLPGPSCRQLRSALPCASAGGLAVLRTFIRRAYLGGLLQIDTEATVSLETEGCILSHYSFLWLIRTRPKHSLFCPVVMILRQEKNKNLSRLWFLLGFCHRVSRLETGRSSWGCSCG